MDRNTVISLERKAIFLAWIAKHCFELAFGMTVCISILLLIAEMPILIYFAFSVIWTAALVVVIISVNVALILVHNPSRTI